MLEARRHHRLSTEIDLFTSEVDAFGLIARFVGLAMTEQWLSRGVCIEQVFGSYALIRKTPSEQFSVFASPNVLSVARSKQEVEDSKIYTHTSSEILVRKIHARMINNHYVGRDAYAGVVGLIHEPDELSLALAHLTSIERDSINFDRYRDEDLVKHIDQLIDPVFPQIVENLQSLLFDTLIGRLTRDELVRQVDLS